jgi:hypothetical protein
LRDAGPRRRCLVLGITPLLGPIAWKLLPFGAVVTRGDRVTGMRWLVRLLAVG